MRIKTETKATPKARANKVKFPNYLAESFGSENVDVQVDKKEDNHFLHRLLRFDQHFDQMEAYAFCEKQLNKIRLRDMSPYEIVRFIKNINEVAARTLRLLSPIDDVTSFSPLRMRIRQETGLPDKEFERSVYFSETNYTILQELHGKKVALDYATFCAAYQKESIKRVKLNPDSLINDIDFITEYGLDKRSDYYAYQLVYKFTDSPEKINQNMLDFSNNLLAMLQKNENPIFCAAYVLYQLIYLHPFVNGNRRTARIFMNCVLLSQGAQPILLAAQKKDNYYSLIESRNMSSFMKLIELLIECSKETSQKEITPLIPSTEDIIFRVGLYDFKELGILTNKNYEITTYDNIQNFIGIINLMNTFQELMDIEKDSKLSSVIENTKREKEKLLSMRADAKICFDKAQSISTGNPLAARYLFHRSARFFEAENQPQKAKFARQLAAKLQTVTEIEFKATPDNMYYLFCLEKCIGSDIVRLPEDLNKNKTYLICLFVLQKQIGSDRAQIPEDLKGRVSFPSYWLWQLPETSKISLAAELNIDRAVLNPRY